VQLQLCGDTTTLQYATVDAARAAAERLFGVSVASPAATPAGQRAAPRARPVPRAAAAAAAVAGPVLADADGAAAVSAVAVLPSNAAAGAQLEAESAVKQADPQAEESSEELCNDAPGGPREDAAVAPALSVSPAAAAPDKAPLAGGPRSLGDDLASRPMDAPRGPPTVDASQPEEHHQHGAAPREARVPDGSIPAAAPAERGPGFTYGERRRTASAPEAAALRLPPSGEQPDPLAPLGSGDPGARSKPDAGEAQAQPVLGTQPRSGQRPGSSVHGDADAVSAAAGQLPAGGPPAADVADGMAGGFISNSRPSQGGGEAAGFAVPFTPAEPGSGSGSVAGREAQQGDGLDGVTHADHESTSLVPSIEPGTQICKQDALGRSPRALLCCAMLCRYMHMTSCSTHPALARS
jgi:hypothetical protein